MSKKTVLNIIAAILWVLAIVFVLLFVRTLIFELQFLSIISIIVGSVILLENNCEGA